MALNKIQLKRLLGTIAVVVFLLLCDQAVKVWIKTNMQLYESIEIFSWFKLYFTENPGMAFGIEIVDTYILTIARFILVCFLGYFIYKLIKLNFKYGFVLCFSCILAGALGNIIDCAFYGMIFSDSYGHVATFMPEGGGYASFLHGKVVDMLYFPLIKTVWPSWIPVLGGRDFIFFSPIFNVADSTISVSACILLLFYRRTFSESFSVLFERKKSNDE